MTNLAYDPDALDLEEEEDEAAEENLRTPKTSVSSVTTPPSTTKRLPFFKKVTVPYGPKPACLPACVWRRFFPPRGQVLACLGWRRWEQHLLGAGVVPACLGGLQCLRLLAQAKVFQRAQATEKCNLGASQRTFHHVQAAL